jgi:hypothetical protein
MVEDQPAVQMRGQHLGVSRVGVWRVTGSVSRQRGGTLLDVGNQRLKFGFGCSVARFVRSEQPADFGVRIRARVE